VPLRTWVLADDHGKPIPDRLIRPNMPTDSRRLVRMQALKATQLPPHPDLAPQQNAGSPPQLQTFLSAALEEAEGFMTGYLPQNFKVKSASKQSPPSSAPVELLSCDINVDLPKDIRPAGSYGNIETWFARTSVHENAAKDGTASWEEFDAGLRADHSQHEMDYTPDVYDAHEALTYGGELECMQRRVGDWMDVQASVMEMVHHIPPPLDDRVFPELVITARKADEFVVIQIPVDTTGMPGAKYDNKGGKLTAGMYCSIERGQLLDGGARVKWQMATASDAKGVLPMWAQKMGVPGAVVKDVGLFMGWTAKRRQGVA